ncbi:MAG: transcription-repair coupling factor, partial [Clostridia bacterium]|nr:transcription-repair coupling factor [Clostridia bacterium]
MNCFTEIAKSVPEFRSLVSAVHKGRLPLGVTGLSYVHKAHVISSLCDGFKRRAVVLVPDEATAERLSEDLKGFGMRALVFPYRDFSYRSMETLSREYEHKRLNVLDKMLNNEYDCVLVSAQAAVQVTIPPAVLMGKSFTVEAGEEYSVEQIVSALINSGYTSCAQIDGPGQFAVRGGILDFF